jgi:nitric oxide dioxygenase
MLSDRTIRTVKSTAPILRERGVDITKRMYERLFKDEHIKQLFNQSHHGESGSQPMALAGAVHAYASHIDRLADLGPAVERIAQKHVALKIKPEHYPYVGRALLGALKDILGQAATDEVLSAWTEAYEFLADILMKREAQLTEATAAVPGGWAGWRDFTVDRVVPESDIIKSFYLKPADGGPIMNFRPGQYLTFQFDVPSHGQLVRNYSLSCAPRRGYYRISVKREGPPQDGSDLPAGLASNYLHDQVSPGTTLRVSAPAGDFFLNEESTQPVVLLSGGVGLTPMVSMLETIVEQGATRPVWYAHAALSGRQHAMKQYIQEITAAHPNVRSAVFYEFPTPEDLQGKDYDESGRITTEWLKRTVPISEAEFYFCGPKGFMRMLALGLRALDVKEDRIHFEFFGPPDDLYS